MGNRFTLQATVSEYHSSMHAEFLHEHEQLAQFSVPNTHYSEPEGVQTWLSATLNCRCHISLKCKLQMLLNVSTLRNQRNITCQQHELTFIWTGSNKLVDLFSAVFSWEQILSECVSLFKAHTREELCFFTLLGRDVSLMSGLAVFRFLSSLTHHIRCRQIYPLTSLLSACAEKTEGKCLLSFTQQDCGEEAPNIY